jgi:hypothetical protein
MDLGLGLEKGLWFVELINPGLQMFLIFNWGKEKKDATQKKLKISNLHKNNTQKTHTHTKTNPSRN